MVLIYLVSELISLSGFLIGLRLCLFWLTLVILVKVWKWVADVLDLNIWTYVAEAKGVNVDRTDEPGECNLLKFVVDKGSNLLSKHFSVGTRGYSCPFDVN